MYVEHTDEQGKRLRIWEGHPESLMHTFIEEKFRDDYPLLNGIELYQDTYFNTKQISRLIEELRRFKGELDLQVHDEVDSLIDFSKKIDMHGYLRFVGD